MKPLSFIVAGLVVVFLPMFCYLQEMRPEATEIWTPVPSVVTPGEMPSDAILLFDGHNLSEWEGQGGKPANWLVQDGAMTVKKKAGDILTKRKFGDCQLHMEFRTPATVEGEGQGRGNSGIFLMDRYEVQVLDSYENATYSNGQCGSIYKQHIPLANACKKPGEWQTYDIIFTAPRFDENGALIAPATFTVLQNGILIQNHVTVQGNTVWIGHPKYEAHEAKASIRLQDHGNPVSYRNIWVREL